MKVGLIGNQNSGKTTLFNCLTGMNAKIGNWPGVTIEKKVGKIKGTKHTITDLPGIYSLSPYSIEEEIPKDFIFDEKPDVIINIVDATELERSLYLTTQLLEVDCRVIVALNMVDILEKKGLKIDIKKLEKKLGVKVCQISALKETGIDKLIEAIDSEDKLTKAKVFDKNIEKIAEDIITKLPKKEHNKKFIAIKLIEDDNRFSKYKTDDIKKIVKKIEKNYDTDLEEVIATSRYDFIEDVYKKTVTKTTKSISTSDKLDKIFLNKWLAFPIFIIIMFLVYYLSVGVVGSATVDWVAGLFDSFGSWLETTLSSASASKILISLLVDGIVAGCGAVLGFVPQLIILFLCISLLETTGYMSRIALLLDKIFRKIGLSGKSLIPFIVGVGCSVPGIMGTRIIENEDERRMTAIVTPFIPCSAKLPIIALFAGYFFPDSSGFVSASLYFFAIIVIIISSLIMKKIIFKNTSSTYIQELPEYKIPSVKYVCKDVFDKVVAFIKRAGTIILLCSIVIWFLLSFSFKLEYGIDIEDSMLASIGNAISWIFYPILGVRSWGATVSAIQGLVAKEQVVSSMAVINGLAEEVDSGSAIFAEGGVFGFFTSASAYAYMVFCLFSAPCFGALGALKRELKSNKAFFCAIAFQTGMAWILATIVYQVGSRIENGTMNIANVIIVVLLIVVIALVINSIWKKRKNPCNNCPYCDSCNK